MTAMRRDDKDDKHLGVMEWDGFLLFSMKQIMQVNPPYYELYFNAKTIATAPML